MFQKFYPSEDIRSTYDIDFERYYKEGYRGVIFDVDNTLVPHDAPADERAKKLFGCDYANVQPHSGAQANLAVFFAMLEPGDKVMGMNLDHGGHLTHGSPVNISGKYFNVVSYGVNDEGVIDYDKVREIAVKEKPKMIIAGASAYARIIDFKKFREIAFKQLRKQPISCFLIRDQLAVQRISRKTFHQKLLKPGQILFFYPV